MWPISYDECMSEIDINTFVNDSLIVSPPPPLKAVHYLLNQFQNDVIECEGSILKINHF